MSFEMRSILCLDVINPGIELCHYLTVYLLFQNSQMDKPSSYLQLGGGHIDDLGQRLLGIDDGVSTGPERAYNNKHSD